jgi:hypothetical protein
MCWQTGKALQVDSRAERDDELVIVQVDRNPLRALDHDHLLLGEVDAHDFGLPHLNPAKQLAQRHDRIGRMDGRCSDFGKQRLEHEVIVGIDELDIELAAATARERLGGEHAAEAAADHEDLFLPPACPSF